MKNTINPCLWFDENAKEAADFYCANLQDAHILNENSLVVNFEAAGYKFTCLNGGPQFKGNPSISFYYVCESKEEFLTLWNELKKEGKVLMPIAAYEFSDMYGWVEDRFNISWQLMLGKVHEVGQKITPCFNFVDEQYGKAEDAIEFYCSVFKGSEVDGILRYGSNEPPNTEGYIRHAQFCLLGQKFMVMENNKAHDFNFNEAVSLIINCTTQEQIDYYWNKLTQGGNESVCGWLRDKFGVSWQVIPVVLEELMSTDAEQADRVVKTFLQMRKIDIEKLLQA